jgi:hypothetical protein
MFGTSKRNVWQAVGLAVVVALVGAWLLAPSTLVAPSGGVLAATMGGTCIYPSFVCNAPDHCANDNIQGTSIYYDYWGGHSRISDVFTGLQCILVTYYSDLNCGTFDHQSMIWACS